MKTLPIISVAFMSVLLVACGNSKDATKSNFSKAIQSYLDTQHGLCAAIPAQDVPFTLANKGGWSQESNHRANALVEAGLLTKRDTEVKPAFGNRMEPATEYQVTDLGKKHLTPDAANTMGRHAAFCSGKYVMVDVDNFTEPSDMMGMKVSRVNFRYKVEGAADWAHSEAVRANFKNLAEQSKGELEGKAALVLTNNGWIHERLFKH